MISYMLPAAELLPLINLLREASDAQTTNQGVMLSSRYPTHALPQTAVLSADAAYPIVRFEGDQLIDVRVGDLLLTSTDRAASSSQVSSKSSSSHENHITAQELYDRFSGC